MKGKKSGLANYMQKVGMYKKVNSVLHKKR